MLSRSLLSPVHTSNNIEATGNFVACCFDNVAVLGNILEATFDFVERTTFQRKTRSTLLPFLATKLNVASTLLLVWTGFYSVCVCVCVSDSFIRLIRCVSIQSLYIHYVSEKTIHFTFDDNFGKYRQILFSKFFYSQIPEETFYVIVTGSSISS